ncbi:MAG: mobile mystery protein B [Alphaproteobacteria bacterium]|nr:mobile mystery protein B [Alphaproteobacteria bacterium]
MYEKVDGQTALSPDDLVDLIPTHITTRGELNEAEQQNILAAESWIFSAGNRRADILTFTFFQRMHRRMFGQVWRWAGRPRRRITNLGVEPAMIAARTAELCETVRYWQDNKVFPLDEIAVRLHHGAVSIHPFPNGNGRFTRYLTDLFLWRGGASGFSWGARSLAPETARDAYLSALRAADGHDIEPLLDFVRR